MKKLVTILSGFIFFMYSGDLLAKTSIDEGVARIKKIILQNGKLPEIKGRTELVQVQPQGQTQWVSANKNTPLNHYDKIKTTGHANALIEFEKEIGGGKVWLGLDTQIEIGATSFIEKSKRIFVNFGEILAEVKGRFEVMTYKFRTFIGGTKFYLKVDGETHNGVVYVLKGIVIVENEQGKITIGSRQAALIRGDQAPQKIILKESLVQKITHWAKQMKAVARPWWQKPGFYIPAATVTAIGAGVLIYNAVTEEKDVEGTVIIRIP